MRLICLISVVGFLVSNTVSAATITVVNDWSFSASHSVSPGDSFDRFEGPTVTIARPSISGTLTSASTRLDGTWQSNVSTNQDIPDDTIAAGSAMQMIVTRGPDAPNSDLLFVEGVGVTARGTNSAQESGEFTSTGRFGSFPTTGRVFDFAGFEARLSTGVGGPQNDDVVTNGSHMASGTLTTTYTFDPNLTRQVVIGVSDIPLSPSAPPTERIVVASPEATDATQILEDYKDEYAEAAAAQQRNSEIAELFTSLKIRNYDDIATAASGIFQGFSSIFQKLSDDPPRFDYDIIEPIIQSERSFDFSGTDQDLNFLEDSFFLATFGISSLESSLVTLERIQGAIIDGDLIAAQRQADHFGLLLEQGDYALTEFSASLLLFDDLIGSSPDTPNEFSDFLRNAAASSFLTRTNSLLNSELSFDLPSGGDVSPVPLPATGFLLIFSILGLGAIKNHRKAT